MGGVKRGKRTQTRKEVRSDNIAAICISSSFFSFLLGVLGMDGGEGEY